MTLASTFKPHIVSDWRNEEFGAEWTLNGLWADSVFDSLPRGGTALWYHSGGSGRFPHHSGYNYVGAGTSVTDEAVSPSVDLTPFTNPEGESEDLWTVYFRVWMRPNFTAPTLGGEDASESLRLIADLGGGSTVTIGNIGPFRDDVASRELSRVSDVDYGTKATETLTFTGQPSSGEEVEIDGTTYTFQLALTIDTAGHVLIGDTLAESIENLAAAINGGDGAGEVYAASTTAHASVDATTTSTTLVATAKSRGTAGNSITTTTDVTGASWGDTTLSGGTDTGTIANVGASGEWWYQVLLAPDETIQASLLGQSFDLKLSKTVGARDATDYGAGIARLSVEVIKGNVRDIAAERGGFGGRPAVPPVTFGKTFGTSSEAQSAVDTGTVVENEPVYVSGEEKWYVNRGGTVTPIAYDTTEDFQTDIDNGSVPDGTSTYVEDTSGGTGGSSGSGFVVNDGGSAVPVDSLDSAGSVCQSWPDVDDEYALVIPAVEYADLGQSDAELATGNIETPDIQ